MSVCVSVVCPTSESMSGWSTLFYTSRRTVKLNFALLVSFHDGGGNHHHLLAVATISGLSAGLYKNSTAEAVLLAYIRFLCTFVMLHFFLVAKKSYF